MIKSKSILGYFSKMEWGLWICSATVIIISFWIFDRGSNLMLFTSLIGVTSLIFTAKGNPIGQFLMVLFSLLYGIISFSFSYYGEMITYLGMTMPMAVLAFVSWIKNPFDGNKSEVLVNHIGRKETICMLILSALVTIVFYFILNALDTANIILSTISVTTSFIAVYLTFRRSPFYAIGYAANDIVLIVLWILATIQNNSYLSVVICFVAFFVNDLYGYINWKNIGHRQSENKLEVKPVKHTKRN